MNKINETQLTTAAETLIELLSQSSVKIVFAESCTAGLIAATLGRTAGVSDVLCGSAVVYRNDTKHRWLSVSSDDLSNPAITAVSPQVAEAMAVGVLLKTPEANISASVTGYLGPDSPDGKDGLAYIGIALRSADGSVTTKLVREIWLTDIEGRVERQRAAAEQVINFVAEAISDAGSLIDEISS